MKRFSPNLTFRLALGTLALAAPWLYSQTATQSPAKPSPKNSAASPAGKSSAKTAVPKVPKIAAIKSFRIVQEKDGPAVEILSTQPLIPAIQQINDPPRLVIDLANARLETTQKRISIQADQISTLRADQFQQNPPVARVVVDLLTPRTYSWDAAGNRLVVHLGRNPDDPNRSPFQPPTVASLTPSPQPVVKAVRAAGPLAFANETGGIGSSFTAGADTAVLSLSSGGEVRVCPGTTVSITPSQNKHNLMLGVNTGALETHFALDASSDSVMTPDFRITLLGPGEFHYAFSADSQGNTCVRALPGNTASAIVTELLGGRTYQVKATDQLVFRAGQLDRVDMAVPLECGCPPPRQAPIRATNDLPMQSSASTTRQAKESDSPESSSVETPVTEVPSGNAAESATSTPPRGDLHVQISAPLVFKATGPPPAPVEDVRALPLDSRRTASPELTAAALPPPPPAQPPQMPSAKAASPARPRGFFHKIGRFFSSIFH